MARMMWIALSAGILLWACSTAQERVPAHRQVLVVITPDWDSVRGELLRMQWESGTWKQAGEAIPVIVGRKGMAWGIGLEDYRGRPGPVKQEGDKRSPAGIFRLGAAFGYAPPEQARFVRGDYVHVTAATMCIEDTASAAYNQILDEGSRPSDWVSTDHMLRKDDLYEWGVWVLHNAPDAEPGGGSCIFLHVWNPDGSGTAGCTSMDKSRMREVMAWLDPAQNPVLLQGPALAYGPLRETLGLPAR
ncbi:MAG: hypothetical protein NW241_05500 [Bacteroidia bacterium]|nr:hypothetical protein [Bacteroidia bacterium]